MAGKLIGILCGLASLVMLSACGPAVGAAGAGASAMPTVMVEQVNPAASQGAAVHEPKVSMRVLWKISGYVLGSGFTGDKQAAQAMLFKPLDIRDTAIIFDGMDCQGVTFHNESVNAADYLSGVWHTSPSELGIDVQELQVFKTNCSLPGFQEYMRLNDGRLIVPMGGVFYFFEPNRNF